MAVVENDGTCSLPVIFLVTMIGRESGKMQQVLIESCCLENMQEFISTLPGLEIADPVVIDAIPTSLRPAVCSS